MICKMRKCRVFCLFIIVILLLPMFTTFIDATERKEQKKIRVGYMIYEGYQEGEDGEVKSGSAYEYYQKIKCYTDWEYEYVYGSVSELLKQLEKGEIDMMACINYTEERAEKYFYSDESHGVETYYLYTHSENTEITPADLTSLNGKNIGILFGSYQEGYFKEWCITNDIQCNIFTYATNDELRLALTKKQVDATIDVQIIGNETEKTPWESIYRFISQPLYFVVNKDRQDILEDLNDAQAYIISTNEYYAYELMEKYHNGINYHNAYLTPRQENYIKNCGTIKVGYLEGTNPLSFKDAKTGEMTGLCAEYLQIMSESYNIDFETHVYQDENTLIQDLLAKKVDIIFPLGMGYWAAENVGVSLSTSLCSLSMTAIYKNIGDEETFQKIAVNKNSPTQIGYAMQYYPNAELYYIENTKEALEAVDKNIVDVYFVRSSSLELLEEKFKIYDKFRTMSVRNDMEAFIATRAEDTTLSVIVDKGISLLSDNQKDSAKFRYTYSVGNVSLWQAMKENIEIVVAMAIIVILLCVVMIVIVRLQANQSHMKMLVIERDKAEKAEQAKTEFLSQMSHDIRTPMNAIIGFTNFIKEEKDIQTIKQEYVPKIEMASNHLLMLINDVLEMSRIETGKLVFQRKIHDIMSIIDSVVTVMRMQAEEKNLSLKTEVSVTDRVVNCDQNLLSRVIMNLLSNAVKFTPDGGKILISVHQLPTVKEGYATYEIKVADTGIGMQPEFLEKVFEPFERERTSTISGMQGTGLGMAIVKNIVNTAGDTISVESTPGKGTTFTLNITLMSGNHKLAKLQEEDEKEETHHSLEVLQEYFKGKRILLVEDNEFNSTIAYTILENAGFLVETAENGQIAVDRVVNAPFADYYDVILMDIQMPVMNGYEATKAIRALKDDRAKVKIIAVTANAFETDRDNAKAVGMDGHVSKPLDVDMLYDVLLRITNM